MEYERDLSQEMGVRDIIIQLSVEIEDPEDLKADLIQALDQIN
jgi:cystathionine beta-lyase/cystathionine gamma-synthase